jgi:peptide/nickel transport system substrate-binding protein
MPVNRSEGVHRRALLRAGAALAATGLSAPGLVLGGVGSARAQGARTLRAGIAGYNVINTLDPGKASLIPEFYVIWALFNGLVKFDAKMNIVPDLAESFNVAGDGSLEIKLRQGIKFHDGSACTADDVKFSFERLLDDKFASPNRSKVSAIDKIEIVDPQTLTIHTKEPFAPLLTFLANARTGTQILPRAAVLAAGDDFGKKPIGTGAYRLQEWRPGERVTLAAFDGYFAGAPKISAVDMPLIAEESSGVTALLGGQLDLTSTAPFADVPTLSTNPQIRVLKQAGLNCRFFQLNTRKAPFDDPAFRRAVSMAFDREALVKAVLFGEGVASTSGLIPPSLAYAYGGPKPLCAFDPAKAKAELAKSKYPNGAEGVVLTWAQSWWKRSAEVFVAMVNQTLGTKLTLEVTDANAVFTRLKAGDFQASMWGWLGFIDADEYTYDILHTKGWRNLGGYSNPKLDALLEQARREINRDKRGALYKQAEAMMIEDMPVIPAFCSNVHNLMTTKVSGFVQLPYSNFGDQFAGMELA